MNPYQPPKTDITAKSTPRRTLVSTFIGLVCVLFGGLVLLSIITSFLELTPSGANYQDSSEALGGMIASAVIALLAGYLVLYGLKKLKGPAPGEG